LTPTATGHYCDSACDGKIANIPGKEVLSIGWASAQATSQARLALRVSLKASDNKAIYGFSFPHPVAEADVAEASKSAQDGLGSWQFAGVAVERSAESGEDDVGGGDA